MTITAPVELAGSGSVLPARRVARRRVSAVPTLAARRLALSVRSPRALIILVMNPVMNPVLFALVLAPALSASTTHGFVR